MVHQGQVLSEREVFNLIFEAGFSTAEKVTNISGRGVGTDVVRSNVQALRGTIDVHSEKGKGSRFMIRLPLTMAIIVRVKKPCQPGKKPRSAYLECGILANGFARARCADCGHDFVAAYSCKGRGMCPSCTTRRMVETAAHLVDHVLPRLPVRHGSGDFHLLHTVSASKNPSGRCEFIASMLLCSSSLQKQPD